MNTKEERRQNPSGYTHTTQPPPETTQEGETALQCSPLGAESYWMCYKSSWISCRSVKAWRTPELLGRLRNAAASQALPVLKATPQCKAQKLRSSAVMSWFILTQRPNCKWLNAPEKGKGAFNCASLSR